MRRIQPTDLIGTSPVWCLDLVFGGQTFRLSSEPVNVKNSAGAVLSYEGGLDVPEVRETLGRLRFQAPGLSATIRAVLPVSVATIRRRGYDWLDATAELYLTAVATSDRRLTVPMSILAHEEMWLQVEGDVRSPRYALPGQPVGAVEFTVQLAPWNTTTASVLPDDTITEARWPSADADAIGKRYPLIIGHPGVYVDSTGAQQSGAGSPAYVLGRTGPNADKLLLAGHPRTGDPGVDIINSVGTVYTTVADRSKDGEGNAVTTADITGSPATFNRGGAEYFAAWTGAGGVTSDLSAKTMTAAPEVAAYFLERAGLRIDGPAWLALAGQIPTFEIAGYINDDVTAWEYVQQHVLPVMPVAYRFTRQGLAPVVFDAALRTKQTAAHVRATDRRDAAGFGDWVAVSGLQMETEPEDVGKAYSVSMAQDVRTSEPVRVITWVGDGTGMVGRGSGSRRRGKLSGSMYLDQAATRGAVATESVTLGQVWDVATANAHAAWRSRLSSMPTEAADYDAPWHWGWLQVGDSVTIDDELKGMKNQIAVINGKVWAGDSWEFELIFDEDPVRDPRAID